MPLSTGSTRHGFDNVIAGDRTRDASVENNLQREGSYITVILFFAHDFRTASQPLRHGQACDGSGTSECAQFSELFIV